MQVVAADLRSLVLFATTFRLAFPSKMGQSDVEVERLTPISDALGAEWGEYLASDTLSQREAWDEAPSRTITIRTQAADVLRLLDAADVALAASSDWFDDYEARLHVFATVGELKQALIRLRKIAVNVSD